MLEQRRVLEVAGSDLVGGHVELGEEIGASLVEGGGEEGQAELPRAGLQLPVLADVELERFPVLPVCGSERVLVVVRSVIRRPRVQQAVVALLELHGVHAALGCGHEQLLRLLDRALVVMADLGDDVAVAVVGDSGAVDEELAHGLGGRNRAADGTPPVCRDR